MRRVAELVCLAVVFCGVVVLPTAAQAQPILMQRCAVDSLNAAQAEARLNWARRCSLVMHVMNTANYFDTYIPSSSSGNLFEYAEDDTAINWSGQNRFTGQSDAYEVNSSFISKLYLSGSTYQGRDSNNFYEWWRARSRKKIRPTYPTFGSLYDVYSASNMQLFPHPTQADCRLYLDRNGTMPTASAYYVNGYCEASASTDRCHIDRLNVREARERLDWARRCALSQNVGSPSAWFDTGVLTADSTTTLKEYSEANVPPDRSYMGDVRGYDINDTYIFLSYLIGKTNQSIDAQGYYRWTRDASLLKKRPQYPIYGNSPDSTAGVQYFPHPTYANCTLYQDQGGTTPVTSFYVNKYCDSIY
jgi:hypothetical protein